MLDDLLKGAEKSRLILVTDETECPGRHLLLNWIHNLGNRCDKIILICFERHTDFFTNWLPVNLQNKIIAIDYRSSNLGRDTDAILDKAISMTSQVGETVAVVIDSLSLHITLKSAAGTCHLLHKLASGSSVAQVVALLHRDVHDRSTCSLIEHIASSVIDIVSSTRFKYTCCIRHCRSTGKVYKSREYFVTDDNFHIENFGSASPGDSSTSQKQVSKVDPTAELPFSLSLTDSEKDERSKVKLPYLKDQTGDTELSSGQIFYQPDSVDDFDDEDPDDDLNI